MKTKTAYAIREQKTALGASSLQLHVYDIIGSYWDGGDGNTTALLVVEALNQSRSATEIGVRINSLGGIYDEANAIRAVLISHPANVTVDIDGVAASAATIIMAAGNKVRIGATCAIMIHEAAAGQRGREADLLARAAELKIANDAMAELYAAMSAKRGKNVTAEQFRKMMAKETWFSAEEAVAAGLADEIVDSVPESLVAQVDLSACRAIPGWVAERFAASSTPVAVAAPIVAQRASVPATAGDNPMKFAAVLALLGITESTAENSAMEAVSRIKEDAAVVPKLEALTGATGAAALVVASGWKQEVSTLNASLTEANAKLATAEAAATKAKADAEASERTALFDRLVAEGRLVGEEKIAKAKTKTLAELQDLAEFLPVALPGSPTGAPRPADQSTVALTEDEKADAKSMGMSEADYLKHKQTVAKKYGG